MNTKNLSAEQRTAISLLQQTIFLLESSQKKLNTLEDTSLNVYTVKKNIENSIELLEANVREIWGQA